MNWVVCCALLPYKYCSYFHITLQVIENLNSSCKFPFSSVDISAEPRLKKLRHTEEERSIGGLTYQSRLRTQ